MEVYGTSMIVEPSNVIFLSSILNREGAIPSHKCDKRCQNEQMFGNMYRCKLTGTIHICDKNCNQRILYDNHSSLCRVSEQIFPFSPVEEQAVRGFRRKLEVENTDGRAFKRRRDAQLHPSPFESLQAVERLFTGIWLKTNRLEPQQAKKLQLYGVPVAVLANAAKHRMTVTNSVSCVLMRSVAGASYPVSLLIRLSFYGWWGRTVMVMLYSVKKFSEI